jgi:hypothetical protein
MKTQSDAFIPIDLNAFLVDRQPLFVDGHFY